MTREWRKLLLVHIGERGNDVQHHGNQQRGRAVDGAGQVSHRLGVVRKGHDRGDGVDAGADELYGSHDQRDTGNYAHRIGGDGQFLVQHDAQHQCKDGDDGAADDNRAGADLAEGISPGVDNAEGKADSTGNGGQKRQDQTCALFICRLMVCTPLLLLGFAVIQHIHGGGQYGQGGKDDLHGNEGVVIPGAHADKAGAAGYAVQRVGVGQRVGLPCHGLLDGAHQLGVLTNILGGPVGKLFADSGHRVLTGEGGHRAAVEGILLQHGVVGVHDEVLALKTLEAPLAAQNVLEQAGVGVGSGDADTVEGGHDAQSAGILDGGLGAAQLVLAGLLLSHKDGNAGTVDLGIVEGEMLGGDDNAVLLAAADEGNGLTGGKDGILGIILMVAGVVGGAVQVGAAAPEDGQVAPQAVVAADLAVLVGKVFVEGLGNDGLVDHCAELVCEVGVVGIHGAGVSTGFVGVGILARG